MLIFAIAIMPLRAARLFYADILLALLFIRCQRRHDIMIIMLRCFRH